jgi:hypothetical protein
VPLKYHKVYAALVEAVSAGRIVEPFGAADFRAGCPGFAEGTYRAFLWKHSGSDKVEAKDSVLLERTRPGRFKLVRPFKYDF